MTNKSWIPSGSDLLKAYNHLQSKKPISETELVQWSQWSRFDPRLAEQVVHALQTKWSTLNPIQLRTENQKSKTPQTLLVLLEHLRLLKIENSELFELFYQMLALGVGQAPYQAFYIGLQPIAGKAMQRQSNSPHPLFSKWGFYAVDPAWSKTAVPKQTTMLDPKLRKEILRQLLKEKRSITVDDYLEACHHAIHRRQAERDLKNFPRLKASGNTRSRVYHKY